MTNIKRLTFIIILCFLFNACATHKALYKEDSSRQVERPNKEIDKTFYLIGDAGKSPQGGMSKALTAFNKHIANKDTKNDYTIFLGDNIYPEGLPKEGEEGRANAENALNGQIKAVENFKGDVLFIPGNHDWYSNGLKGLKRQEKYIEEALGKIHFNQKMAVL